MDIERCDINEIYFEKGSLKRRALTRFILRCVTGTIYSFPLKLKYCECFLLFSFRGRNEATANIRDEESSQKIFCDVTDD